MSMKVLYVCDAQGCTVEMHSIPDKLYFSSELMGLEFIVGVTVTDKRNVKVAPHLCPECRALAAFQLIGLVHEKVHPCAAVKDRPSISDKDWDEYLQWKEEMRVAS